MTNISPIWWGDRDKIMAEIDEVINIEKVIKSI